MSSLNPERSETSAVAAAPAAPAAPAASWLGADIGSDAGQAPDAVLASGQAEVAARGRHNKINQLQGQHPDPEGQHMPEPEQMPEPQQQQQHQPRKAIDQPFLLQLRLQVPYPGSSQVHQPAHRQPPRQAPLPQRHLVGAQNPRPQQQKYQQQQHQHQHQQPQYQQQQQLKQQQKQQQQQQPQEQQPLMPLKIPEVIASVRSLYTDDLKPFGRVLLKRLRERAAAMEAHRLGVPVDSVSPEDMPRVDPKRLRKVCQCCSLLRVEAEEGKEYSVFIVGKEANFIDVCAPEDYYSPEMWDKARRYFESLPEELMKLPGGRYACARVLHSRKLPFLKGFSLGQISHIVQLAISQKKLLGYLEGQLVPFWASDEWLKERCARNNESVRCALGAPGSLPVASWEDVSWGLTNLLTSTLGGERAGGVVSLSNVKRLFNLRFNLEFSETALGYSRLYDLLQDPRLADVCTVQTQGNGQIVVKRAFEPVPFAHLSTPAPARGAAATAAAAAAAASVSASTSASAAPASASSAIVGAGAGASAIVGAGVAGEETAFNNFNNLKNLNSFGRLSNFGNFNNFSSYVHPSQIVGGAAAAAALARGGAGVEVEEDDFPPGLPLPPPSITSASVWPWPQLPYTGEGDEEEEVTSWW